MRAAVASPMVRAASARRDLVALRAARLHPELLRATRRRVLLASLRTKRRAPRARRLRPDRSRESTAGADALEARHDSRFSFGPRDGFGGPVAPVGDAALDFRCP